MVKALPWKSWESFQKLSSKVQVPSAMSVNLTALRDGRCGRLCSATATAVPYESMPADGHGTLCSYQTPCACFAQDHPCSQTLYRFAWALRSVLVSQLVYFQRTIFIWPYFIKRKEVSRLQHTQGS
ncbi:uncharacterized protein [Miscanthus floridulus]|uniref:uncharacterized protein n=1 Tax=Miscanthus floridulus TaxID=154761 RepID=UPI0034589F28